LVDLVPIGSAGCAVLPPTSSTRSRGAACNASFLTEDDEILGYESECRPITLDTSRFWPYQMAGEFEFVSFFEQRRAV
jgi:hypothetical protein